MFYCFLQRQSAGRRTFFYPISLALWAIIVHIYLSSRGRGFERLFINGRIPFINIFMCVCACGCFQISTATERSSPFLPKTQNEALERTHSSLHKTVGYRQWEAFPRFEVNTFFQMNNCNTALVTSCPVAHYRFLRGFINFWTGTEFWRTRVDAHSGYLFADRWSV